MFLGCRSGVAEASVLLEYDTSLGTYFLAFRDYILVSHSGGRCPRTMTKPLGTSASAGETTKLSRNVGEPITQ
jgi:hypothetical protein